MKEMDSTKKTPAALDHPTKDEADASPAAKPAPITREIGGPKGPEPTRYGDWEQNGRCSDF
jgi:hypothetical protein